MVKICAVGDPHGGLAKIRKAPKNIDFYLVTGDLGKADLARKQAWENKDRTTQGLPELEYGKKEAKEVHAEIHFSTLDILKHLSKSAPVYTIQGNVGLYGKARVDDDFKNFGIRLPSTLAEIKKMKRISLVKNRLRIINGLRIGFLEYFIDTSWIKEFKPSNYKENMRAAKKETSKARRILKKFGKVDILVCHQPPFGILDKVTWKEAPKHWRGKHAGSKAVLDYIKKFQPKYVFCGHIHEGEGKKKIGKTTVYNLGVGGNVVIDMKP